MTGPTPATKARHSSTFGALPESFGVVLAILLVVGNVCESAPITFGVISKFATGSASYASTPAAYVNYQALAGLMAAFYEANQDSALGAATTLRVRVATPTSGNGLAEATAMTGVTGFVLSDETTLDGTLSVARARGIPVIGGRSAVGDPDTLYLAGNAPYVANYRFNTGSEYATLVNYALNSRLRCRRFGILHSNRVNSTVAALTVQQMILNLALSAQAVSFDPATAASGSYDDILQFYADPTQVPQCLFLLIDSALIPSFVSTYQSAANHQFDDTFYLIPSSAYHPRFAKGTLGSQLANLFVVEQRPDPLSKDFTVSKSYRAALDTLVADDVMSTITTVYGTVDSYTRDGMEGYLLGRLIINVLSRDPTASGSGQTFLDNLFLGRYVNVDDLVIGPFSDGCIGHQSVLTDIPCQCNSGNKLIFMVQVNKTAGVLNPVPYDESLGEKDFTLTVIPSSQCGPAESTSTIFIPYTFLQVQDTSAPSNVVIRMGIFRIITQILFRSFSTTFGSRNFVLVSSNVDLSGSDPASDIAKLQNRYPALAWIGSSFNRATLAQLGLTLPLVRSDLVTGLDETDPPLSDWQKQEIFLSPTRAEFVHGLASFISSRFTPAELSLGVGILTPSSVLAPLAEKSLNTFQVKARFTEVYSASADVITLLESHFGTASTAQGFVILATSDTLSISAALQYAASRPGIYLFLACEEEAIDYLVHGAALTLTTHNVFFASQMPIFWDPTERGTTIAGLFWASLNGQPGTIVNNGAFLYKTYRMLITLYVASLSLSGTATSTAFFNSIYGQKLIQVEDESFGPFSSDACSAATISANQAKRQCQCSKSQRNIYVFSVADWRSLATKSALNTNYQYSMPPGYCGIDYQPLAPPAPALSNRNIIIIAAVGGSGLIVVVALAVVAVSSKKTRNTALAPKDSNKPFAIAFTDIQSSTNLWARAPGQMGPAVEKHHELIREIIPKRKGYEVKTVGDSFMVAFSDPNNAVLFAVDLQEKFQNYQWDPAIDRVYKELDLEKREAWAAEHPGKPFPMESGGPDGVWGGVRVRIGINWGIGEVKLDEVSLGYDYYGTVVNTAARIEASGHGGQIVISEALFKAISQDGLTLGLPGVSVKPQGSAMLRGLDEPLQLIQVVPESLAAREFGPLRLELEQDDDDEEEASGAEKKSRESTASAASVFGRTVAPVDVVAEKFARRWKRGPTWGQAYRLTLQNFYCLRALFSTASKKDQKALLDAFAAKWRVSFASVKQNPNATEEELYNHQLMQVVVKMTPASEAVAAQFVFAAKGPEEEETNLLASAELSRGGYLTAGGKEEKKKTPSGTPLSPIGSTN